MTDTTTRSDLSARISIAALLIRQAEVRDLGLPYIISATDHSGISAQFPTRESWEAWSGWLDATPKPDTTSDVYLHHQNEAMRDGQPIILTWLEEKQS